MGKVMKLVRPIPSFGGNADGPAAANGFSNAPAAEADRLHALFEAICEGRRLDAIDLLVELNPSMRTRSLLQQHRLFPGRVPAPGPGDRA